MTPVVGDFVEFDQHYILAILPRKNRLPRPPVANVDQALLVMSAKEPNFSTQLLDRYLVYIEHQQIQPMIIVSKWDLLTPTEQLQLNLKLKYYQSIGYQVVKTALENRSPELILEVLQNQVSVVMGQTGVGKSTLLNQLLPALQLATAEISQSLNRGKHTTREVTLYPVAAGWVADTPGFSSLDWHGVTTEDLPTFFPDFVKLSHRCQFRGCLHLNEPGCAIKEALESAGEELSQRYQHYQLFNQELIQQRPHYQKKKRGRTL